MYYVKLNGISFGKTTNEKEAIEWLVYEVKGMKVGDVIEFEYRSFWFWKNYKLTIKVE